MRGVIALILGGGRGARLQPLTHHRAKPAVPFAGNYRLVDIPISNCIHANIKRMYCMTQYKSYSLNRHVTSTYRFDMFTSGSVTVLAAEQREAPDGGVTDGWFTGTADAVRKNLHHLSARPGDDVIILSGDQVYRMDLERLILHHRRMDAEVTIAATRVSREDARRYGVMRVDRDQWIRGFAEKPEDDEVIDAFRVPDPRGELTHLASMGIYVFRYEVLKTLLKSDDRDDFGKHILPSCIGRRRLNAYPYSGYWEDVGTIGSYHRVCLELTDPVPAFNLFDERYPIYTRARFLPAAKIGNADIDRALLSDGCIIADGTKLHRSVIGIRTVVGENCCLERVVACGAGSYVFDPHAHPSGVPLGGIGSGSTLRDVVIDRDTRIGRNVRLVNERGVEEYEDEHITVRDGIIVVPKAAFIPDGYTF